VKLRLAIALAALPVAAHAGNGDLPRTPVIHLGESCLTVVDRSVDPVVHLRYTIPNVDICLTADEPPDSRTHQLIAFCHGDPTARITPHWLTRAEADAGAGDVTVPASDILAEHPDYADCWTPTVPAAERRPITCQAARDGVDWDTTGLARGTYTIRGYTYEPPQNDWSPRLGAFKIVDGPDRQGAPPSVGFANIDTYLWLNQPMTVRLCVDAMDGSTVSLAHAFSVAEADPEPDWITFIADEPVSSGTVTLEFLPPAAVAGQFVTLRAEIVDPMDRRFTAYMQGEIKVETIEDPASASASDTDTTGDADTASDTSDTGDADDSTTYPVPYDFCADNPDADRLPDCPGTSSSGDDTTAPEPGGGCCSIDGAPTPAALLVLLALRRRRRVPPAN